MKNVEIKTGGGKTERIELDKKSIDFYKQETRKIRVTERGLSKFFSNLFDRFLN
jgi:hypothetical protein